MSTAMTPNTVGVILFMLGMSNTFLKFRSILSTPSKQHFVIKIHESHLLCRNWAPQNTSNKVYPPWTKDSDQIWSSCEKVGKPGVFDCQTDRHTTMLTIPLLGKSLEVENEICLDKYINISKVM